MSYNKTNFLLFRSPLPWIILGLVIIVMWVAGSTQKTSVLANPAVQEQVLAFATFVFDLSDGGLVGSDGPREVPDGPGRGARSLGELFYTDSPGCITLVLRSGTTSQICDQ